MLVSYFVSSFMLGTESIKCASGSGNFTFTLFAGRNCQLCKSALILMWSLNIVCPHFNVIKQIIQPL